MTDYRPPQGDYSETIRAEPDAESSTGSGIGIAGFGWLTRIGSSWQKAINSGVRRYSFNLDNIDFVTLASLTGLVALVDRLMVRQGMLSVDLDMKMGGSGEPIMLTRDEYRRLKNTGQTDSPEYLNAERMFDLVSFMESMGTHRVLNVEGPRASMGYLWFIDGLDILRGHYTRRDGLQTVCNPLIRIHDIASCTQFLNQSEIIRWRGAMADRFRESPLFEFEELWRVFSYELASNIIEHAKCTGILTARVVPHEDYQLEWVHKTFPGEMGAVVRRMKDGFVELCVSDAGPGFVETLGKAYRTKLQLKPEDPVAADDVLALGFDELGTSKQANESWASERHALNRILQIVAKYGGVLTLHSSGAMVRYIGQGGVFKRRPNHMGYEPQQHSRDGGPPGTHIQVLLPLTPVLDPGRFDRRGSMLIAALPPSFRTDGRQPKGHLVPLLETLDWQRVCILADDRRQFVKRCDDLAVALVDRAPSEPLVLDFSGVRWSAPQVETLLHRLQNLLTERPVLLVEMDPILLRELVNLCTQKNPSPTTLPDFLVESKSELRISERDFMETYSRIHAPLMVVDINGERQFIGLRQPWIGKLLLDLCKAPKTLDQLCAGRSEEDVRVLLAVLNNVNPAFYQKHGAWRTVWSDAELAVESRRVMTLHFEEIANRCDAWHGRAAEPKRSYNLPWQEEWVPEFFECSRILSRQRNADEAAQRLIFRLKKGLELTGRKLADVDVLACVTAPAIILAAALHRWWPLAKRPAISDLGPYLLLDPDGKLPVIGGEGGVVVVQDVQDGGNISGRLVELLQCQNRKVHCVLSLVKLNRTLKKPRVSSVSDGWIQQKKGAANAGDFVRGVSRHALVHLPKPHPCKPPAHDDQHAYWVEPRTLRPFSYRVLRRDLLIKNTARERVRPFFTATEGGIVCAGHYVYGDRHYSVTLDIKRALEGEIGKRVAPWLADACLGRYDEKTSWIHPLNPAVQGPITAVLMPLHSRIHYLWQQIETLLAQQDRRTPMWMLDATLFLGHGPSYRLPLQCDQLIHDKAKQQSEASPGTVPGMRLLIIDDAMVSARTAETILSEINRAVAKAKEVYKEFGDRISPVTSVLYFVVFNQLDEARHRHWHALRFIDPQQHIAFEFQQFCSVTGLPVHDAHDCPACSELNRLKTLFAAAERNGERGVGRWLRKQITASEPVATEGPHFHKANVVRLPQVIDILCRPPRKEPDIYQSWTADEAILRFHELMYLSYPPSDILPALHAPNGWAPANSSEAVVIEYERFRWAVLEWALRNWARLVADSAVGHFVAAVQAEIDANSPLVERLFALLSEHREEPNIKRLVASAVRTLATTEAANVDVAEADPKLLVLENALVLFLLSLPPAELDGYKIENRTILTFIRECGKGMRADRLSFTKGIVLRFSRPRRQVGAKWAVEVIAETLFRGRGLQSAAHSSHRLLPQLLYEVQKHPTAENRRLLECTLSVFLAALADIEPYESTPLRPSLELRKLGRAIILSLKTVAESATGDPGLDLVAIGRMASKIDPKEDFCRDFNLLFQFAPAKMEETLLASVEQARGHNTDMSLDFQFYVSPDVAGWHALISFQRLTGFITNWAVNPAERLSGKFCSRVEIRKAPDRTRKRLQIRLLTNFDSLPNTQENTFGGDHFELEIGHLKEYGAEFSKKWDKPSRAEMGKKFKAVFEFTVPTGMITSIMP